MKNRIVKNVLMVTVIVAGLFISQKESKAISSKLNASEIQQQEKSVQIAKDQVCMVNDAFMGSPQIEIPVNDKMYYGCCKMCVKKLNDSKEIRTAIDPLSKEEVDKSEAYIVLDPDSDQNGVLYFKSESTFNRYMNQRK
jgi:hypothetical protein